MKKLLTVVTSAYRCESYLLNYFENMIQLSNRDQIVIILVMNDPTCNEKELSQRFLTQFPDLFQVIHTNRETIGASLNRGLRAATTPYVAYADVDDRRPLDAFERQLATLEKGHDSMFTYGDFIAVKNQQDSEGRYIKTPEFDENEFTRSSCVGPGHFFRRSLLDKIGYYDEQLRSGADFEFQIRAAFHCRFKKTPGVVAYYLLDNRLPSASKTPWQKIDASLISLRYGIYDKLNYDYVSFTYPYDISYIHYNSKKVPIKELISSYDEMMQLRHARWYKQGIKKYISQKKLFGKISALLHGAVQKIERDGLFEAMGTMISILKRSRK